MVSPRTEWQLTEARALVRAGQILEGIRAGFRIIEREPRFADVWVFVCASYCRQGCQADVPALIDQYQRMSGLGLTLFKEVMVDLLRAGLPEAAEALAAACPENHACHILGLYFAGCARCLIGDDTEALRFFTRFRTQVEPYTRIIPFLTDPFFNVIYRQGTLVRDSAAFAIGDGQEAVETVAATPGECPVWVASPTLSADRPVFLCAANNLYFNQFGEGFAASVAALGLPVVLHFHVLNPDEASWRLIAALSEGDRSPLAIDVSTAILPEAAGATWFSCSRFLAAPALIAAYRKPLWLFDIDLELTPALATLVRAVTEFGPDAALDVGVFDTGRYEPASRFSAATVYLGAGSGSRRFLALLERFLRPRLTLPLNVSWMLDQAALYSTIVHCRQAEPTIAIADFFRLTGLRRDDVFVSLHPGALKNAMRWNLS